MPVSTQLRHCALYLFACHFFDQKHSGAELLAPVYLLPAHAHRALPYWGLSDTTKFHNGGESTFCAIIIAKHPRISLLIFKYFMRERPRKLTFLEKWYIYEKELLIML